MNDLQPLPRIDPAQYRHYKGGLYEVLDVARHSESLEPMVIYRPLYGESGLWVRPFGMFFESVVHEGRAQARFSRVGPAASPEQGQLVQTVARLEATLSTSAVAEVGALMGLYRQLAVRFERDLGTHTRDVWLAKASALMLVQAVHHAHGLD